MERNKGKCDRTSESCVPVLLIAQVLWLPLVWVVHVIGRVLVNPYEIDRALHHLDLFARELREPVPHNVRHRFRVLAIHDRVDKPGEKQTYLSFVSFLSKEANRKLDSNCFLQSKSCLGWRFIEFEPSNMEVSGSLSRQVVCLWPGKGLVPHEIQQNPDPPLLFCLNSTHWLHDPSTDTTVFQPVHSNLITWYLSRYRLTAAAWDRIRWWATMYGSVAELPAVQFPNAFEHRPGAKNPLS